MQTKKILLIIGIILIIAIVIIIGIFIIKSKNKDTLNNGEECINRINVNDIIGKWNSVSVFVMGEKSNESGTITFNSDKTFSSDTFGIGSSGTYEIDCDSIILTDSDTYVEEAFVSLSHGILTITLPKFPKEINYIKV